MPKKLIFYKKNKDEATFQIIVGHDSSVVKTLLKEIGSHLNKVVLKDGTCKMINTRPRLLNEKEMLLLTLIWCRQYPVESYLAWMMGVSETTINLTIQRTMKILADHLKDRIQIPNRAQRDKHAKAFAGTLITVSAVVDGTSQETYASPEQLVDHMRFSVHRDMPCWNRLVLASPKGRIYWISKAQEGGICDGMLTGFSECIDVWAKFEEDEFLMGDSALLKFHNSVALQSGDVGRLH